MTFLHTFQSVISRSQILANNQRDASKFRYRGITKCFPRDPGGVGSVGLDPPPRSVHLKLSLLLAYHKGKLLLLLFDSFVFIKLTSSCLSLSLTLSLYADASSDPTGFNHHYSLSLDRSSFFLTRTNFCSPPPRLLASNDSCQTCSMLLSTDTRLDQPCVVWFALHLRDGFLFY